MTKYAELAAVTRILLEKDLDKHRQSVEQSKRIARELAQIDALREVAQADLGAITARQMIGADTLWQGWMVRKRAEILRRAAFARAAEDETMSRAKLAFSRNQAAEELMERDRLERIRKRVATEADRIDEIGQLREQQTFDPAARQYQ